MTAIGAALGDLGRRYATANLGGVVVFSDFNQNAGPPAVEAARRLGVPVYTVGVGATTAVDVAVEVQAPRLRAEGRAGDRRSDAPPAGTATARGPRPPRRRAAGRPARRARRTGGPRPTRTCRWRPRCRRSSSPTCPDKAGRFELVAEVDPVPGEVVRENNRASARSPCWTTSCGCCTSSTSRPGSGGSSRRSSTATSWWGMQGFRTFLHSSDPRVRRTNELFLPSMAGSRAEFFAHDVIFLGDMPASALSPRFCEMTKEFVRDFGGGLVVLAGPRFGVGQLADTPLARDAAGEGRAGRGPGRPPAVHTAADRHGRRVRIHATGRHRRARPSGPGTAWARCPGISPSRRVHPQAVVLAEHPTRTCVDGKQKQPLIAVRPYGRGEVIYLGFNETWRLRRMYGERYYRQFWGQMIQRLALEPRAGQPEAVRRADRPPPLPGRRAGDRQRRGLQRRLRAAGGERPAEPQARRASCGCRPRPGAPRQGVQPLSLPQTQKGRVRDPLHRRSRRASTASA